MSELLSKQIDQIMAAREAGHVQRCHVVPHHGAYNIDGHSYNALSLLLILHPAPGPSLFLVRAVLWHDHAERFVGDMPATAKWINYKLGEEYELCEARAHDKIGLVNLGELSDNDRAWLDGVDKLELYMWCLDQEALGNRHTMHFATNLDAWLEKNRSRLPDQIQAVWGELAQGHGWRRLSETIALGE